MREGALRKNATRAIMYIFLIAVSLISVFPLYWSFISAFNNTQQILGGWLLPSTHLLENLQHLFEQHNVARAEKLVRDDPPANLCRACGQLHRGLRL